MPSKRRACGWIMSARLNRNRYEGHRGHQGRLEIAQTNTKGEAKMPKLTRAEAEQRLAALNGWTLDGDAIRKQYTFKDFVEAIAFVNRLAPQVEAADHHPDILINYKRVTLTWSTHSEGGLTEKDFAGAATADRLSGNANDQMTS